MAANHEMTLSYTIDDDGIWLRCSCGELKRNMGFGPTPDEVSQARLEHVVSEGDGIRIQATDLLSGESGERVIAPGDYCLVVVKPCEMSDVALLSNRRVQIILSGFGPR